MRFGTPLAAAFALTLLPACALIGPPRPAHGLMPTPLGGVHRPPPGLFEGPAARNGCDDAMPPVPGDGAVAITFGGAVGEAYRPRCITVRSGRRIEFTGDLAAHPLAGGVVFEGRVYRDPGSEIPYTSAGSSAAFVPQRPGVYPFFCQIHWVLGMRGAIIVE